MISTKVTKQKVVNAARTIALKGQEPTLAAVRAYLGSSGSQTTIHKYLKAWKLKCFQATNIESDVASSQDVLTIKAEKQALELALAKLQEQNKIISSDLIKTERKNIELNYKAVQAEQQLGVLEDRSKTAEERVKQLDELYQNIKAERATALEKMTSEQNKLIDSLREELKQSHQASIEQIKENSYNSHDALLQEKVKNIHLQENNKALMVKLTEVEKELNSVNLLLQPLRKKVESQSKLIKEVVTFEQLQAYEKQKYAEAFEGK